jgi:hypothetical protein
VAERRGSAGITQTGSRAETVVRAIRHDTISAWDAIDLLAGANIDDTVLARKLGGNAAGQFRVELQRHVDAWRGGVSTDSVSRAMKIVGA